MAIDDSLIRTVLVVIAVILLLPFLMMVVMMPMMGLWGGGHMWGGGMGNSAGTVLVLFLTLLVPLLVILGIGYLLYRVVGQPDALQRDAALEELRTAYARGEITDEEFEERRKRLQEER